MSHHPKYTKKIALPLTTNLILDTINNVSTKKRELGMIFMQNVIIKYTMALMEIVIT